MSPQTINWIALVIGPLTGGLIGLGAAWLSNFYADKRDERKIEADAVQKDLDRKLALKKEVYLSAVSDLARIQNRISSLVDVPIDRMADHISSEEFGAVFAKLEIVAPLPLCAAGLEVAKFTLAEFGPLMHKRLKLQLLRDRLAERNDQALNSECAEAVVGQDSEEELEHAQNFELEFRKECLKCSLEVKRKLIPFIREIRREFDTSIDMKRFERLQSDIMEDSERQVELAIQSFRKLFMDERG